MNAKKATVEGKGSKTRPVHSGRTTARALWQYLKTDGRELNDPLFITEGGGAFTRSGVTQLINRLGQSAQINTAR